MNPRILLLLFCIVQCTKAQQLFHCDTTFSYWTFVKDSSFFSIKITGNVKPTNNKNVVSVNGNVLQNVITEKNIFVKKDEENTEMKIIIRYILSEGEYFTSVFKQKVNLQMMKAPLGENFAIVWFFDMPAGHNKEVKRQVFATILSGDKIFGLNSSQFNNQKFETVRDFLMDIISTLKSHTDKKDFIKFCK